MGIRCVHDIEQKYSTARLHARGIGAIPYTKVTQVYSSYTGLTVEGMAPLGVHCTVHALCAVPLDKEM